MGDNRAVTIYHGAANAARLWLARRPRRGRSLHFCNAGGWGLLLGPRRNASPYANDDERCRKDKSPRHEAKRTQHVSVCAVVAQGFSPNRQSRSLLSCVLVPA